MIALAGLTTACSDKNDEPDNSQDGSKIEMPSHRMFILNEGSFSGNNANISMYAPATGEVTDNLYLLQNETLLGDVAMDMVTDDGFVYISVYGSNYLMKLNSAGVLQGSLYFSQDPELQGGVRYIDYEDGYVYASFYGGVVAKINAKTMTVEKKLTGLGANLEGVAIENDNLYVADSYELTTDANGQNIYNYKTDLKVIDLKNFTFSGNVTVGLNPNLLDEEDDNLFLISYGNYYDVPYSFQMIEPKNGNKVTKLAEATLMGTGNDMVYLVNSVTDWATYTTSNTFFSYDVKKASISNESFLKNAPAELSSASIYMISVDSTNGDIYIGVTNYVYSNGEIYRFDKSGQYISKFDCGGMNPRAAVYF